jgi:GMP synthase (glutamine-hydrolysing)
MEIKNRQEAEKFIKEQVKTIKDKVQRRLAIGFLSGGVDSSVAILLGYRAIGSNLKIFLVDNGLLREGEIEWVLKAFSGFSRKIQVSLVRAADRFFAALSGKSRPYEKRVAVRDTFYKNILPELAFKYGAKFLLQGTNLTDIEATLSNSKAPQHNVLEQIGINIPDLRLVEPLKELRKPSVRKVAKTLGLSEDIWSRMPFPGPALAARIDGEVTPTKVEIIRKVTSIVERGLKEIGAFQYFPVLVSDNVPNYNRAEIGYAAAIRCIDSIDAVTAQPTKVDWKVMLRIRDEIYSEVPMVFRVMWDISPKPPASVEWQ